MKRSTARLTLASLIVSLVPLIGCEGSGFGATPTPGEWVELPAGTFMMGSPKSEPCRFTDEDLHEVKLTRSFELHATETTQGEFKSLMGYNPSGFKACGDKCPVEQVSWHEAAAYCNALSKKAGYETCYSCSGSRDNVLCREAQRYSGAQVYECPGYRLPTEAEWEYAYRAGTKTAYYDGTNPPDCGKGCKVTDESLDEIAWYGANSKVSYEGCFKSDCGCLGTHPVGKKKPNAWFIYDIAGNVYEYCHDIYIEKLGKDPVTDPWGASRQSTSWSRLLRGGSWSNAGALRAALRFDQAALGQVYGFRCARTAK